MILTTLGCLLTVITSTVSSVKVPDYFDKCTKNDKLNDCILSNARKYFPKIIAEGDKSVKLKSLNPMVVKLIDLQASPTLKVTMKDSEFSGFETINFKTINFDVDKNRLVIEMYFDWFKLFGKYDMSGHLMNLPIQGVGDSTLMCKNVTFNYEVDLKIIENSGKEYYNINDDFSKFEPEMLNFKLTDLFDGDEELGEAMNSFMNENWKSVFLEVRPAMTNTISSLFTAVINQFLTNIPISELWN